MGLVVATDGRHGWLSHAEQGVRCALISCAGRTSPKAARVLRTPRVTPKARVVVGEHNSGSASISRGNEVGADVQFSREGKGSNQ